MIAELTLSGEKFVIKRSNEQMEDAVAIRLPQWNDETIFISPQEAQLLGQVLILAATPDPMN